MFPTLIRRFAERPAEPAASVRNTQITSGAAYPSRQFKPKKVWPPDFSQLSEKEQFRFERRYKRRVMLATARPRWDKFMKLAQLSGITFVVVYSVLFMDWGPANPHFEGIRENFWGVVNSFSTKQRHERRNPDLREASGSRE